jgi:hypothetical protein
MKNKFSRVCRCCGFLLFCFWVLFDPAGLFAFTNGDRVQANGLVYVRQTAGGTYIGSQASGTQGTVLAGPTYSQIGGVGAYYYWYNIDWPSAPDGWVADIGLISASLANPTLTSIVQKCDGTTPGIEIQWTAVSGASNYEIYRNGVLIYTTAGTGTVFWNAAGLTAGQNYSFQVKAKSGSTTSGFSSALAANAPNCNTPSLTLSVSPTSSQQRDWNQSVAYTIIVKDNNGSLVGGATVAGNDGLKGSPYQIGPTASNGQTTFTVNVPPGTANATYNVTFVASKSGYDSSSTVTRQIQVNHSALPGLPLNIGLLAVNGNQITSLGNNRFTISGNVTLNNILAISAPVTCDLNNSQVSFSGILSIVGNSDPDTHDVFSANTTITIDAQTGAITGASLNSLDAMMKIAGIDVSFSSLRIVGGGLVFSCGIAVPNLSRTSGGGSSVSVQLTDLLVDGIAPYLHSPNTVAIHLTDVYLARSEFGIQKLDLELDFPNKRFAGNVMLALPSGSSVGGSAEIVNGHLNAIMFNWTTHVPIYSFTGGDSISLTSLSGGFDHLIDGPFTLAGGVGLAWGVGAQDIITVNGTGMWDANWNINVGGEARILDNHFKIANASVRYQNKAAFVEVRGQLGIDDLFSLDGLMITSFNPSDRYFAATAQGTVGLPKEHWAYRFADLSLKGQVAFLGRQTPQEKYLAGARISADFLWLFHRSVSYQYDMRTHQFSDTLDYELVSLLNSLDAAPLRGRQLGAVAPSRLNFPVTISDNKGFDGVIIRLRYQVAGAVAFNLRRPDGNLITPLNADQVNLAYAENPAGNQTVYLLRSAENGVWNVEFDDTGLGSWSVEVLAPHEGPKLTVSSPSRDLILQPTDSVTASYDAANFKGVGTVNIYLDDDKIPGGGVLVASAPLMNESSFVLNISNVPPGVYYVSAVVNPEGQIPLTAYARGKIILAGESVSPSDMYVTTSSFRIDWNRHRQEANADTFHAAGVINPSRFPMNLSGVAVRLKVNGTELVGMNLGSDGRFISPSGSQQQFRFSLNAHSGAFLLSGAALDLRDILGIAESDIPGVRAAELAIEISNSMVEVPLSEATMDYTYRTSGTSAGAGSFLFQKHRSFGGSFISLKSSVLQQSQSGLLLSASGRLLGPGGEPVTPNNDVIVTIGGTNVIIPLAALSRSGASDATSRWNYSPRTLAVPGLQQFIINNATRSFAIKVGALSGTGVPMAGNGGTSYILPVSFKVPTVNGTKQFETVIELKRSKVTSLRWVR